MTTALNNLKTLNSNLNTSEPQISVAQKSRYDVYFTGDDCLQKKFQAIKKP